MASKRKEDGGNNCPTSKKSGMTVDKRVVDATLAELETGGNPLMPSFDDIVARESYEGQFSGSMEDDWTIDGDGNVIELRSIEDEDDDT